MLKLKMAGPGWTRAAVSVLLDEYERHPCLYAIKSKLYHNRVVRRETENEIAKTVSLIRPNTHPTEVKAKINGLRTQFTNERNKVNQGYRPTFVWYYRMLFLLEHSSLQRTVQSNKKGSADIVVDVTEDVPLQADDSIVFTVYKDADDQNEILNREEQNEIRSASSSSLPVYQDQTETRSNSSSLPCHDQNETQSISSVPVHQLINTGQSHTKRKRPCSSEGEVLTSIKSVLQTMNDTDVYDEFGRFVSSTLKNLRDPKIKQQLKHNILKAIMDAEQQDFV